MANKNIYEIFDAFKAEKTKKGRVEILQKNDNYALRNVLLGTFHPNIQFLVKSVPDFRREKIPQGMSYNHMTDALSKIYLFMKDNLKAPPNLTDKRRVELLTQLLESLEEREADVYLGMLNKNLNVPYLTEALVNEAFPGLLPQS